VRTDLAALPARYHQAFNDRDFDVWREVFDEDVELLIDGISFRGADAAVAYGVGSVSQFPGLYIASERIVAQSDDTIVTEIDLVTGHPASGHSRPQGTTCEICRVRDGRIVSCRSYYMPEPADRADAVRVPARAEAGLVAEEQAALRRVATLVVRGASQDELFAAVTQETGWLVSADTTTLLRFELDDTVTLLAAWSARQTDLPIGASRPVDEQLERIRESGRPWRWGPANLPPTGPFVEEARVLGMRTFVGVPIVVDRRIWGVMFASSAADQPFADDAEARLAGFTELVATALANAQARVELRTFADEQAALRRVATLVAEAAPPADVFAAVAAEVGRVLAVDFTVLGRYDADGAGTILATWTSAAAAVPIPVDGRVELGGNNVATQVFETGRPARRDSYANASGEAADVGRGWGLRSLVGTPISVEGQLWGVIIVAYTHAEPLPPDTEARLASFTELVATAIANAQARVELRSHADEQAALRRVATLVARVAAPEEVFAAVTAEVGRLLYPDVTTMNRYDPDGAHTAVGAWSSNGTPVPFPVGTRTPLGGRNVISLVFETGRPARMDDFADASGPTGDISRGWGARSAVGVPISVEGRLWGVMSVGSGREPLPADTEQRLATFTELVATAIANAQARVELRSHAEEQAALRRLATLVAQGEPPEVVFAAATREARRHFGGGTARMIRFEPDGTETLLANEGTESHVRIGERWEGYPPTGLTVTVRRTGRAGRVDDYREVPGSEVRLREGILSSVAVPIYVNGRLWGMIAVGSGQARLPHDTEQRMAEFTDLVATAVANAQNLAELITSRARIVTASDQARRRIERDLHDGAQQRLVSLVLQLRSAGRASQSPEAEELATQMDLMAEELTGALDELREIARGIHPAALAEGGLRPALKGLARRFAVPVRLDVGVDGRLPNPIELAAYYVIAEALTNAAKHAGASEAQVQVESGEGLLRVCVRDDGRGGADLTRGSGLVGLTDRVEALGGHLTLESPLGAGTAVQVVLPLRPAGGPRAGEPAESAPLVARPAP
jgi:GAF domain-containing protein/ketosteroid isomerase-like protein